MSKINTVSVRWLDGYFEEFECSEVSFGAYILWMHLADGKERIVPLTQVRWFGQSIESHQCERPDRIIDHLLRTDEATEYMRNGGTLYTLKNNEVFHKDGKFFKVVSKDEVEDLSALELSFLSLDKWEQKND
jgi:hypothetical protein